jgi:hypothetical protein
VLSTTGACGSTTVDHCVNCDTSSYMVGAGLRFLSAGSPTVSQSPSSPWSMGSEGRISCGGMPHIHLLLAEETAVHQRQKVFGLRLGFFPLLVWIPARGRCRRVDPSADLAASSRDLFFPATVFMLFDGDGFILQRQRVFTRIRSGLRRRQAAAAHVDL